MECILLLPNNLKKSIIKKVREEHYNKSIKFMSLEEFIKKITFDYNERTIYYLMKDFDMNYYTCKLYLDNLYYIDNKLDNEKMKKLIDIKKYLDDNNLLIYNNYFKEYVKDKEIYIYGYNYINKYYKKLLKDYNYKVIDDDNKINELNKIYYADYIEEEVIYVGSKICKLLNNNISIEHIKIIASNEYERIIDRVFGFLNIPVDINKNSLYGISSVKKVIDNLDDISLFNNIKDNDIIKKLVNIINKYSFINDKKEVKDLIINDLKSTYIENNNGIKLSSINDYFDDNDYVFLMGFNKENYPKVYKDNDYFSDKEKEQLGLDNSTNLNIKERENIIKNLLSIKNLTITYKLSDDNNIYIKSDLLDTAIEKIKIDDYTNSNMLNKVLLCQKLDNLVKYNIEDPSIGILSNNYNINYMNYDNKYKTINKDNLYKYLDNKLTLSYTSFDNYNKCRFKYFIGNILKINIIKNDFAMIIGNVCHYLLSCMNNNDFDIDKYFDDYISKERSFSKRELFFLDRIKEEIVFIIDTLKKQLSYSSFDKELYEKKVYVNKDKTIKINFMGVIDKVRYKEEDGVTYLAVIDYKTGSTDIKLNNMEYGLGMQLPIYLYLSNYLDLNNIKVVGFYLQKLLVNVTDNKKDYIEAKEDTLKLEGYSINEENILSKFDNTYNDSKLIKGMKTSSKGFYSYSKVLSTEEIDDIINKTDKLIDKVIDNILEADFSINPKVIDGDSVSCNFCEYKDICFKNERNIEYINRKEE